MQGLSVEVGSGSWVVSGGSSVVVASVVVDSGSEVVVGSAGSDVVVVDGLSQERSGSSPS